MGTKLPADCFFQSVRPPVIELPHLITALDAELLGKVAHLTKSKPGLWGVAAPFDENDVYDRARESAPFSAWALPANQAEVLSYGLLVQETVFGVKLMMLDATFDEVILARLAVSTGERMETGAYVTRGYQDFPELRELVEQCGWVLIPIGPERSKGLFIVSRAKADWITKLREWCERAGRNQGEVRLEGDALVFDDRAAPKEHRENAIAHHIDSFLSSLDMYFGGAEESILPMIERRLEDRRELRQAIAQSKQAGPPA